MDPALQSIILGVVSNGCTAFISHLGHKVGDALVGKKFLEKWELEKTSLQPVLQNVPHSVAENVEWQGPPTFEEIYAFLHSPEVETIIQQIYSLEFSDDSEEGNLEAIRKEFLISLSLYTGLAQDQLIDTSKYLFDSLIKGCEVALDLAVDKGKLSAHEAKSNLRYRLLSGKLSNIELSLTTLLSQQRLDIQKIYSFEKKYLSQVSIRHEYITPPTFDKVQKLPIQDLYVNPSFSVYTTDQLDESSQVLDIPNFLTAIHRTVLLGNPGAGKSTFSLKLTYDLATKYSQSLLGGRRQIIPLLIILRDYGVTKKDEHFSILEFIEMQVRTKYQIKPPDGAIEYLLLSGRAMVIFDGLDELLDTRYRLEISNDIEVFCSLYPLVSTLVTSRFVGYEQAPLNEKYFEVFNISPFNEKQVEDYVVKWFNIVDTELPSKLRQQKVSAFMRESKVVPDLRTNPLMLALICNIYHGENYIPRNRPEVYEKCATMLFERWDKSRDIRVQSSFPFDWHMRPLMEYLAYWIFLKEKTRGITENEIIEKTTDYLEEWLFEDHFRAEKAAQEFIEFCKGRAWVFTDVGTTSEGVRLYQFTHTTFLEYFTASYLVRDSSTPRHLMSILLPRIAKREWDVVAQLSFQLQSRKTIGGGDQLLNIMISNIKKAKSSRKWNLLSFTARALNYLVPRPKLIRDVIRCCIEDSINLATALEGKGLITEIIRALLGSAEENRLIIADMIEKVISEIINIGSEPEAALASSIGLFLPEFSRLREQGDFDFYWRDVSLRIFDNCSDRVRDLCPKYFSICYEVVHLGKVHILDFIKWYGILELFTKDQHNELLGWYRIDFADMLLIETLYLIFQLDLLEKLYTEQSFTNLKELSQFLLTCPLPYFNRNSKNLESVRSEYPSLNLYFFQKDRVENLLRTFNGKEPIIELDSNIDFSIFILLAIMLEVEGNVKKTAIYELEKIPPFKFVSRAFLVRLNYLPYDQISDEINKRGFNTEQQDFIKKWLKSEIDLTSK